MSSMNMIVAHMNLDKLLSTKDGGGMLLFFQESAGGNAGRFEGYPCSVVNFRYDQATGAVTRFTNAPSRGDLRQGYFRFVMEYRCNRESNLPSLMHIVEIGHGHPAPERQAVNALNATAILYNASRLDHRRSA